MRNVRAKPSSSLKTVRRYNSTIIGYHVSTGASMLRIRQYQSSDHDAVWSLHNRALLAIHAHAGNGPWDDDLHHIERAYLGSGGEFLVGTWDGQMVAMGAVKRITLECVMNFQ